MSIIISISQDKVERVLNFFSKFKGEKVVFVLATIVSILGITFSYFNDYIVRYGDSESHLNIAKRVVDSITPGFAQLGGIWLPLPHILMLPFIWFDPLWRNGLAGSFVSGAAFVIAAVFIYKTSVLLMSRRLAAFAVTFVFILNPNAIYMQATPMTEMLLIAFFILSTYYFIKFLLNQNQLPSLLLAGFFGFCSVLTRYDGWFLVVIEAGCVILYYLPWAQLIRSPKQILPFMKSETWRKMEGSLIIFITLAFFGILIWLMWDYLILGDPLYFTNSEFSAKSQQEIWRAKGQLPAYHNLFMSFLYYFVTTMTNAGLLVFFPGLIGIGYYLTDRKNPRRLLIGLILGVPFIFNIVTLFIGQSVIFISHLTPYTYQVTSFNVRYGLMSLPFIAIGWGYLYLNSKAQGRLVLILLMVAQFGLYYIGYSKVVTWEDGYSGLSAAIRPDAERWIKENYDSGMVLMDDYARTVSIVRSGIPMEQMIYIGNKPYWEESLLTPDKYSNWIVMQENDAVWNSLWEIPARRARLDKYFEKVYQSQITPNIAIYKKKDIDIKDEVSLSIPTFWNHQCMDTMKFSRDASREFMSRTDIDGFIDEEMSLIKGSGANCVALGTPYDEEFVPILTKWVNSARAKNLKIWFRGNMSGWEGWFGYAKYTNPNDHHIGVANLISKHPELFEQGDIFTPAPEPENGILGDPRFSLENKQNFLDFLPKSYSNCVSAFKAVKIDVTCGYFSVNGDVAKEIFTKDLLVDIGDVLVIDHYVKEPAQLVKDIQAYNKQFDTLVMLGEIGAPIPDIHGDMTEEQQAAYMSDLMQRLYEQQDILLGMNYWVLRGGSTTLLNENTPRQAYYNIKEYFAPAQLKGVVRDTLGKPVPDIKITVANQEVESSTNENGEYTILIPARDTQITINNNDYEGEKTHSVNLISGEESTKDFVIDPNHKSYIYRLKLWWKNLKN